MPPVAMPATIWCGKPSMREPLVTEVGAAYRLALADVGGRAGNDDPPGFQQVGAVGEIEGEARVLLHQQDAHALLLPDAAHDGEDLLHDEGREAERGLVQQQQPRDRKSVVEGTR